MPVRLDGRHPLAWPVAGDTPLLLPQLLILIFALWQRLSRACCIAPRKRTPPPLQARQSTRSGKPGIPWARQAEWREKILAFPLAAL
jgi:hypothetical protein